MKQLFLIISCCIGLSACIQIGVKHGDYFQAGNSEYKSGDYRSAIDYFTKAIEANISVDSAYYNRALAKGYLKDHYGSIEDFNSACRLNPDLLHDTTFYNRGYAKSQVGDKLGALADYTRAIRLNPNYLNAYHNRGVVQFNLGKNEKLVLILKRRKSLGILLPIMELTNVAAN